MSLHTAALGHTSIPLMIQKTLIASHTQFTQKQVFALNYQI